MPQEVRGSGGLGNAQSDTDRTQIRIEVVKGGGTYREKGEELLWWLDYVLNKVRKDLPGF